MTHEELFVQLPTDHVRTPEIGYESAAYDCGADLAIDSASRSSGLQEQHALLAALVAVFQRYTQQSSIVVDQFVVDPVSKRELRALLRCPVDAMEPMSLVMARIGALLSAKAPGMEPAGADGPASNVAVTFVKGSANGAAAASRHPYDVHFYVADTGNGFHLRTVVYNARLFRVETIRRLVNSIFLLWAAARTDPSASISALPILDAQELRRITIESDSGHADYLREPVYRRFETLARAQPHAVAATFQGEQITYGELDARANRLAHYLVQQGIGPKVPVGVCVQPSIDVLVGMLAAFKAGGVYLPLDPTHPEALILTILDEAAPRLVLTQSKLKALTKPDQYSQFCFDTDGGVLDGFPATAPVLATSDDPLERGAYQLYTSGTTGKPKGVIASHGNLAHYVNVARQKYGFRESDVFCSLARYTFSISMFELVSPLCCGGSVRLLTRDEVLAPDQLAGILQTVTVVHAGPSLLGNLFRHLRTNSAAPQSFPQLRHASSGGDMVPPHILEEMKRVFANAEIYVIYGCTEISCMGCTYFAERGQKVTTSYVGKPFPDVAVRLLDSSRNVVPIGVVGEICFAGQGVVSGYVNRPELTAEKFIEVEGRRFYTTGDMGRLDSSGNLEILGRRDFQVQLRGIRVELAGIENTVRELGLATQCIVLLKKLDEQDVRLVAYVVNPQSKDLTSFRRALAVHLPDYMLPQSLVTLEALPLTANGKVDRRKLQEMPIEQRSAGTAGNGPRNAVERKIAGSFARILGVPEVGIDDDFFDLGGHSLLAVQLLADLENVLGFALSPSVLFEGATVRALASHTQNSFASEPKPILLNGGGAGSPLYVLVGIHLYRELAKQLSGQVPVYAVYAGRELVMFESTESAPSVTELAREYVDIIRRHQKTGPYRLVGMSFGGIVAYEVAQQLRAAGEKVTFLCMLDAILPERGARARLRQALHIASRPRQEVWDVLSDRLRAQVKKRLGGRPDFAEYQKYGNVAKLAPLEDQRQDSYQRATEAYMAHLRPFSSEATLIVAERRMQKHLLQVPSLGWADLIPRLNVHLVDSDHLSLLEEPRVVDVAGIVREGLRRSER